MPLDLLSLGMGFVAGVAGTAAAWSLTQRNVKDTGATRVAAASWALTEVSRSHPPAVMAERLEGVDVPPGAKVIVPRGKAAELPERVLRSCDVRTHPDVRANYALGRERALVFSSHIHPRAHAVYTTEEPAVRRLQAEFTEMWKAAEPVLERVSVEAALARADGRFVQVQGSAVETVEYRGAKMLRLVENGHAIGVVSADGVDLAELAGKPLRVTGRVSRSGADAWIEARRVERVSPREMAAAAAPA